MEQDFPADVDIEEFVNDEHNNGDDNAHIGDHMDEPNGHNSDRSIDHNDARISSRDANRTVGSNGDHSVPSSVDDVCIVSVDVTGTCERIPEESSDDVGLAADLEDTAFREKASTAFTVWEGDDSFYPAGEEDDDPVEDTVAWENCPVIQKANLLYQVFEDSNPKARVSQFFSQYKDKLGFDHINDFRRMYKYETSIGDRDPYNDDEAEMKYMLTKPTCFIILGKPIHASRNLAMRLADYWGCIVVDAGSLVAEELENDPDGVWGRWLRLKMMKGEAVGPEKMFELIFQKIHSPEARHVGYVLVGVPMIPNTNAPIADEYTSQLAEILESDMFPDVIINVTCPENDVCYLQEKLKYDPSSGIEIDYHILGEKKDPLPFSVLSDKRQQPYVDDWEEYEKENNKLIDASDMHHCFITLPHNWIEHLHEELSYYHTHILPFVDKAILGHDQKYVIRLDGRTSSYRMFEILKSRLEALPLARAHPVIMMARQKGHGGPQGSAEGEGGAQLSPMNSNSVSAEEDSSLNITGDLDKAFTKLSLSNTPGSRFRWHWSTWGKRCPVTSTKFNDVQGKAEFACRFMDKIYFIATEEACKAFTENPRLYLSEEEEHLPDRICIAGPRLSGKTSVVNHLAHTLGAEIFDMKTIEAKMLVERPCKQATSSLAKMVHDTLDLSHREALLSYIADSFAYHKNVLLYQIAHPQIQNIFKLLSGEKKRGEIPTKDIVFKKKWLDKFLSVNGIPKLPDIISVREEFLNMVEEFTIASQNEIARSWILPATDRAYTLAEKLRFYCPDSKDEKTGRVIPSMKTWIVDNAPLDSDFWSYLRLERALPNRVIFLHDVNEDYEFMISKFVETDEHQQLSRAKKAALERASLERAEKRAAEQAKAEEEARIAAEKAAEKAAQEAADEALAEEISKEGVDSKNGLQLSTPDQDEINMEDLEQVQEQVEELVQEQESIEEQQQVTESNQQVGSIQEENDIDLVSLIEEEVHSQSLSSLGVSFTNQDLHSTSLLLKSLNVPIPEEYSELLENLYQDWLKLKHFLRNKARADAVVINGETLDQLLEIANERTNFALLPHAREKTQFEKLMERRVEHLSPGDVLVSEDGDESEEANNLRDLYYKMTSMVQFGDTKMYCPVMLRNKGILYPGKEQYTCIYRDKTYRLSSRKAEEEFLANPTDYVEFKKPVDYSTLAPRICVVGPIGSGKTTLAKMIADTLKCHYFNFDEMMEDTYMKNFESKIGRKYEDERVREVLGLAGDDFDDSDDSEYDSEYEDSDGEESGGYLGATSQELETIFQDNEVMKGALRDYLVFGKRIPYAVLDGVITDAWFSEPVISQGMVLDGFPSRPSDIDYMNKRAIVPNLIIHLEINDSVAVARVFQDFLDLWRDRQAKLRALLGSQLVTSLIDSDHDTEEDSEEGEGSNDYELTGEAEEEPSGSNNMGLEPHKHAVKRITENIKFWFTEDSSALRALKAYAKTENIRWVTFPGKQKMRGLWNKSMYTIRAANCLQKVNRIRELDTVRYVTHEESDALLRSGYCLISKFAHWCPVQVYEEEDSFQRYRPYPVKNSFPIIYRKHIYFIASLDNLYTFEGNPQKYVHDDSCLPLVNIRVAVLGPPKCGKTKLASRLAEEFGLRVISAGDALRYVLISLPWTDLAKRLKAHLSKGRTASPELLMEAVDTFIIEERCTTGGFVYDGFPNSEQELQEMEKYGILPMVVLRIDPGIETIMRAIKGRKTHTSNYGSVLHFSEKHLSVKLQKWYDEIPELLKYIQERYQNVYDVSGPVSKWYIFEKCVRLIDYRMLDIQSYDHSIRDSAHSLRSMCVTPEEFDAHLSPTTHYCAVCWVTKNQLITEGYPPPAHGIVQYRDKFYYVCKDHREMFLSDPTEYSNLAVGRKPMSMPAAVADFAENQVYANGLCIVTFVNNEKPVRRLGLRSLAVKYGESVYLFADKESQGVFLENPELYCGRSIKHQAPPSVDVTIPPILTLGYLEQRMARIVNAAVRCLVDFRPSLSRVNMTYYASVFVGLQLITLNPDCNPSIKRWAQEQIKEYHAESDRVRTVFQNCRYQIMNTVEKFWT